MSDKLKKALIGALVAVALALAVSYGLISQQTADQIQNKANDALSDQQAAPAPQQPAPQQPAPQPSPPQGNAAQSPAPTESAPQNQASPPRQ